MTTFSRAAVLAALAVVTTLGVVCPRSATATLTFSESDGDAVVRKTTGTVSIAAEECAATATHLAAYVDALTTTSCGVAGAKADRLATASAGLATAAAGVAALAAAGTDTCVFNATEVAAVVAGLEIADLDHPCGLATTPRVAKRPAPPKQTHPRNNLALSTYVVIADVQPTAMPTTCCSGTTLFDNTCCVDECDYLVMLFGADWGMTMEECCGNPQNHELPTAYCPV